MTEINKTGKVVIGYEPKGTILKSEEYKHLRLQGAFDQVEEPPVPILKIAAFTLAVTIGGTGFLIAIAWMLSLVLNWMNQ